ncbi:uncharacterized protein LOC120423894 isoform X1 [Culex pipiens pallens]|uniref:uncharacterized protein LOC120423894 isoform X1 n=1 Tax=Culex pipiens pallens TaxID=42434 RepID=UPI0019534AC8|nr:uncharacterized protein LOC120423894 isoform X1 [Culex pipiens pallens]
MVKKSGVGGFVLCCLLAVVIRDVHGTTLYPADKLSILEGAGFLVYLVPDRAVRDSMGGVIRCSLTLGDESYSLESEKVHTIGQDTTVQRFSADVCGIRVHNVRASLGTDWTLKDLDERLNEVNHTFTLTVIKQKQNPEINIAVSDTASSFTVTCPEDSSRRYCRILDEADNIYDGCSRSFDITWDQARYRCRLLYWGDMDETETVINVRVERNKRAVTWSTEENEKHVVLNCHYNSRISPCRAVSVASRRQMMLLDGHLANRYSAYNTMVSEGICALEIQKPLIKDDRGLWRIYLELSGNDYTGCVFDLSDPGTEVGYTAQVKPQLIEVFHDPRSSSTTTTELECESPYPLSYCYLSGPQGGDFKPEKFDHLGTLGICRFKVSNITTGKWACGRNDNSGGEDRFTYYDVKVYDQPARAITPQITASSGDENRDLLCKTILDLPIEICRFISPTGEVHGLSENIVPAPDSRFKYHGKGLREGECGMQIMQLEREDFGRWKCSIMVQGRDYAINVDVIEEVMSTTTIVAICVAVTLVLGFVGGFFAYRKLNSRRVPYRNSVGSNGGLSLSSSINT